MLLELLTCATYNTPLTHTVSHNKFDYGYSFVVASMMVLFAPSSIGLLTMMCLTLPSLSYVYIGALTKSLFLPTYVSLEWSMYVCSSGSDVISDDAHVEVDPNFFLTARCDFEELELTSNSTFVAGGFETNHLRIR